MSEDIDYEKQWNSMTNSALIDFVEGKFLHYKELGYEVGHFRSMSAISDTNGTIVNNRSFYHELKTIDEMDEYLKNKNK